MKKEGMNEFADSFNTLWNWKRTDGGFILNIFTIFRICFMMDEDFNGKFIQFNIGIYKLSITIQIGID